MKGSASDPHRGADRIAEVKRLRVSLPTLSYQEQAAIHLRFWENMLIEEIAQIFGCSWDEANGVVEGALNKLRHEIIHIQPQGLKAS